MHGFGSHTYQWINAAGERFWVKYHFRSRQGDLHLDAATAEAIAGADADYYRRDLHDAIEAGDFPAWDLHVQVMPYEDAKTYRFNPFDLTKVWPHADYPLIPVGTLTLDRNPANFFAEIEQAAFCPANTVPGIAISPDKMLMARVFCYPDAQRYRVGTNYNQIPVNAPHAAPVHNYSQDGAQRHGFNAPTTPVYAPNSFGGPTADAEPRRTRAAGRPTATSCAPRRRCTPRTTTSARPARSTATCSPPRPRRACLRRSPVRQTQSPSTRSASASSGTGRASTPDSVHS